MKKQTKQKLFDFLIFIIERFYTEDLSTVKKWMYIIIYPFSIIRKIIMTPFIILFSPVIYWYFLRVNKINAILKHIFLNFNKEMI
jgi:hypothetical protein